MRTRDTHTRGRFGLRRELLPSAESYYTSQGLTLQGFGDWRSAVCPFHEDTHPSLRIRLSNGAFRCMTCGAKGHDIIAFHQMRHGICFIQACQDLGAWEGGAR